MRSWKREIAECVQSPCKIFLPLKNGLLGKNRSITPGSGCNQFLIVFLLCSLFLLVRWLSTGGRQEEFPNTTRTQQEHNRKNMFKNRNARQEKSKMNFAEALYTLCNFPFLQPYFCHVNRALASDMIGCEE